MTIEQADQDPGRVSRQEFYPIVGPAVQKLELLVPTFHEKLLKVLAEVLTTSGIQNGAITYNHLVEGEVHQSIQVVLGELPTNGGHLLMEFGGDWTVQPEVIRGLPIIANYDGAFFRKRSDKEIEPITKEGDILGPDDPFGLAAAGKDNYWLLYLPPREFPDGGRITKFVAVSGEDVETGKTTLCYAEK